MTESDVAASRWAFPIVGLGLGLAMAALSLGLDRAHCPASVAAALLVATLAIVTGGLHLDGLADSADGLFLGGGPERRLAAMKDPHVGSHGLVAVVLVLLAKYAALASAGGSSRAAMLLMAATASRTLIPLAAGLADYPRATGTGQTVVAASGPIGGIGLAVGVLILNAALFPIRDALGTTAAIALTIALVAFARRRIGGVTGDISAPWSNSPRSRS